MSNQNSKKENLSTIFFSPTGDNLPPIEVEDKSLGVIIKLLDDTFAALNAFLKGKAKGNAHWIAQVVEEHKEKLISLIIGKRTMANTGTSEYNEIQEDIATKAMKDFLAAGRDDMVNHPKHYNTDNPVIIIRESNGTITEKSIECIDVIRNMPAWKGNAVRYLWRCGLKKEEGMSDVDKEIEDLEKAIWYIKDRIKTLKEEKSCLH